MLVTGFEIDKRRVTRVLSDHGPIGCEIVVNAAGIWAKRVGEMAGVAQLFAAGAVEHQYIVTEKKIDVTHMTPTFRDPDRIFYLKPDVKSFAIGGWEKGARPAGLRACRPSGVASSFLKISIASNPYSSVPPSGCRSSTRSAFKRALTAPIPVSADGEPILGPAPELDNFYVACGFTAGIAAVGVGPASPWPIGLSIATRAWTCGRSTFAVLRASNRPAYTSPSEARKLTAATIRSIGRAKK